MVSVRIGTYWTWKECWKRLRKQDYILKSCIWSTSLFYDHTREVITAGLHFRVILQRRDHISLLSEFQSLKFYLLGVRIPPRLKGKKKKVGEKNSLFPTDIQLIFQKHPMGVAYNAARNGDTLKLYLSIMLYFITHSSDNQILKAISYHTKKIESW